MNKKNIRNTKNKKVNKKINKRKLIIAIIILLIILLIMFLIVMKILSQSKVKDSQVMPVNTEGWLGYKNKLSDVYEGNKDTLEISTKIKQIFEIYIPTMSNEIVLLKTDEQISNFYNEHTEYINNRMCIKNEEEFNQIIKELLELKVDLNRLNYCIYLEGSYKKEGSNEKIGFAIYYSEDKRIVFDAIISEKNNNIDLELKLY